MAKPREPGWLPFLDGEPLDAGDLDELMGGDATEAERTDGPAVVGVPAAGGGQRHIIPAPDEDSDLERLELFLAQDEMWEMIENLEELHEQRQARLQLYGGRRRGAKRGYRLMDVLVVEVANFFFDNADDTLRNLRDPKTWKRLRKAVRRAFPKNGNPNKSHRRLSEAAPSRGSTVPSAAGLLQRRTAGAVQALVPPNGGEVRQRDGPVQPRRGIVDPSGQDASHCQ